jgi:Mg-chelatase subunit ChlD
MSRHVSLHGQGTRTEVLSGRNLRTPVVLVAAFVFVAANSLPVPINPLNSVSAPMTSSYRYAATWRLTPTTSDEVAPLDVAVGPHGDTYVADSISNLVVVFDPSGNKTDVWWPSFALGFCDGLYVPQALDLDPTSGRIYVLWLFYHGDAPEAMTAGTAFVEARTLGGVSLYSFEAPAVARDLVVDRPTGHVLLSYGLGLMEYDAAGIAIGNGFIPVGSNRASAGAVAVLPNGWLATVKRVGQVEITTREGKRIRYLDLGHDMATAVATGGGGLLYILARPEQPGPDAPMVVKVDSVSGKVVRSHTARELGVSPLPVSDWPFSIAVTGEHVAVTSAGERFEVGRLGTTPVLGTMARNAFDHLEPVGRIPCRRNTIPLTGREDDVVAVDGETGHVVRLDSATGVTVQGQVDSGVVDATLQDDHLYLITQSGRIQRRSLANLAIIEWDQPCDCLPEGRVSASESTVFVAQPVARRIAWFDAATGLARGYIGDQVTEQAWPADVLAWGRAQVLAAGVIGKQIQRWTTAGVLDLSWPAGYVVGPSRLGDANADGQTSVVAAMLDGSVEQYDPRYGLVQARWWPRVWGYVPRISDIAADAHGRVYVSDSERSMVHVFEPVGGALPTPADPRPSATPSRNSCRVTGDKVAGPRQIMLGSTAQITLSLSARCPAAERDVGADLVLVIDHSTSMISDYPQVAEIGRSLVEMLDLRRHRVGLVGFPMGYQDIEGQVVVPLTMDGQAVVRGIESLQASQSVSNSGPALRTAARHLSAAGRPEALPVVVLFTDGYGDGSDDPVPIAVGMRAAGVQIFTIGLRPGIAHDLLRAIAGNPERYFYAPKPEDLRSIYLQILHWATTSLAGNLVVEDEMAPGIELIPDSAQPRAVEAGGRLEWRQPVVPGTGITMTYQVRPQRVGLLPTNRRAVAHYQDVDGSEREYVFPVPGIEVFAPTATPTETAEPSPTASTEPTRAAPPVFLPLLLREQCAEVERRVDIALVLDTSSSMRVRTPTGRTKLEVASEGALELLRELKWSDGDQAAVVTFNSEAMLVQELTGDAAVIEAALARLETAEQTRIHRGIEVAYRELTGPRHHTKNLAVMVLLTDGRSNPDPVSLAVEWSDTAKAAGIVMFTIGLGDDLDVEPLRAMASRPVYFYTITDPALLWSIFRQIAGTIPCSPTSFWGRR